MKIQLNKENKDRVVIVQCKKDKGSILVKYVDIDSGELISESTFDDLELKEYNVEFEENEKYTIVDAFCEEDEETKENADVLEDEEVITIDEEDMEIQDMEIVTPQDTIEEMKKFKSMLEQQDKEVGDIIE